MSQTRIVPFQSRYLPAYVSLNRQWIETYFRLEPMDLAQLEDPRSTILRPGGEILFLLEGEEAVGTCALVPHGPRCFELAKMAVCPDRRGLGYGNLLMQAALAWCRQAGAEEVLLLSNTILAPAISLYKKHGFEVRRLGPHPDYDRCNIEMARSLKT